MKYILTYNIFEARIGDYIDPDKIENPEIKKTIRLLKNEHDEPLIDFVRVDSDFDNIFGIKYDNFIPIKYNDSPYHSLKEKKRLEYRTNMRKTKEFNQIFRKTIQTIYPEYFFKGVHDFAVFDHKEIPYEYQKNHMIEVNDKQHEKTYYIPFTISKYFNKKTEKYEFLIYVISIINSYDVKRAYKTFFINVSDLGEVSFNGVIKNDEYEYPYLPKHIQLLKDKLDLEEDKNVEERIQKMIQLHSELKDGSELKKDLE